jgi:glutamyl-tRNA synthetase
MDWKDPVSGEIISGFREKGFLPEAFVNMLAVLGWNDGTEQELYSLSELIEKFSIERVHKAGARFNYEKAKWFNQEWIRRLSVNELLPLVRKIYTERDISLPDDTLLRQVITLTRDRCHLLPEFYDQGKFFFAAPHHWDMDAIKPNGLAKLF